MLETITSKNNYTIKQIFKENWNDFYDIHKDYIRDNVFENIKKILACGDKDKLGYNTYMCNICGNKKYVPHTCKSRFCNSCGKILNDNWIIKSQDILFNMPHKHLVFTIPSELWLLFCANRKLLSLLFLSAQESILGWTSTQGFLPGIVEVMHTFGSKLNFNCHVHVLCTLGGFDNNFKLKLNNYIPAKVLKIKFKSILLKYLRNEFNNGNVIVPDYVRKKWLEKFNSDYFFDVQNNLYNKEWYFYIGKRLDNIQYVAGYIGRYAKRPSLAETRIVYYSKSENVVEFEYKDKTKNKYKKISLSIESFIGLLIRHIPEKNFHMIRYSGMYANVIRSKIFFLISTQLVNLFGLANLLFEHIPKKWETRILKLTGKNPLECLKCKSLMELFSISYRPRNGPMKTITLF